MFYFKSGSAFAQDAIPDVLASKYINLSSESHQQYKANMENKKKSDKDEDMDKDKKKKHKK